MEKYTPETMKLLRKNKSKITKNENDEMYLIYKLLKEY